MPPPPDPDPVEGVAPDGSPVEVFDVVVLASHFVNSPIPTCGVRCSACAPQVDGVTISWHDVVHRGDVFDAVVTYEVDGRSWTQRFSAEILDDEELVAEAAAAGLEFHTWLDPRCTWARFIGSQPHESRDRVPENRGLSPALPPVVSHCFRGPSRGGAREEERLHRRKRGR